MYQVINDHPPMHRVTVDNALKIYRNNPDCIIAYVTRIGNGMGILQRPDTGKPTGFEYHSNLVKGRTNRKYTSSTVRGCIEKVINSGRTVIVFDNFAELIEYTHSMKCTTY